MNTKRIFLFGTLILTIGIHAQFNSSFQHTYPEFQPKDAGSLLFGIENHNFFKNNEYFGDYIEGYTLTGYDVEPSLSYYLNERVRIKMGIHLKKFNGIESFSSVVPALSAHVRLTDSLHMIIGTLRGSIHHRMIEPIYDTEWFYNDPVENGIQFLYSSRRFKGDMWLNWEQFIEKGDTIPEILTFGISSEVVLNPSSDLLKVSIPFQIAIRHRGGQVSDFKMPMLTLMNGATGFSLIKDNETGVVRTIQANAYLLWFKDMTGEFKLPFTSGWAFYPTLLLSNKHFQWMGGYFHAKNYASPLGSPLFQSVSMYRSDFYRATREMLTGKLSYVLPLAKGTVFSLMTEAYYDMAESQLEYTYGISLVINPRILLFKPLK